MSYLDQITVGSVTYDLQDSNAQRKILEGAGAPTTSTVGTLGQHYYNTSATQPPYEYVCVGISGSTYTWLPFGMTILKYGASGAWAQFLAAYKAHEIVYCRASSNANPATGSQTRLAFMAYVNNETNPTSVEFQYYRSVNAHSATQQGDQVYVYKLASNGTWSVEVREAYTKIAVGAGLSSVYSSGTLTLSNSQTPLPTVSSTDNGKVLTVSDGAWAAAEVDALPSVTSSDNGKVLEVVSGTWSAAEIDTLPSVTSLDDGKYLGIDNGDWTIVTGVSDIYYGSSTPPSGKKVWIDPSGTSDAVLPTGGTTGQILAKSSNTDYAVTWVDQSGGGSDKVMVVTITYTYASSTYSSDKTINEIMTAIGDGCDVFVKNDSQIYALLSYSQINKSATFQKISVSSQQVQSLRIKISYNTSYTNNTKIEVLTSIAAVASVPSPLAYSFSMTIADLGGGDYYVLSSDLDDVAELYALQLGEPFRNVIGSLSISDTTNSDAHPNYDVYPLTSISWSYDGDPSSGEDKWKGTLLFSKVVTKNGHNYFRRVEVAEFEDRYDGWNDAVIIKTETLIS